MKNYIGPLGNLLLFLAVLIWLSIWYVIIKPILYIIYIIWNFQLPPKIEAWTMGEDPIEEAVSGPYFAWGPKVIKEVWGNIIERFDS